ncbi:uncharacterized protein LOC142586966 [Dermacentor variabilis]|uniref:uncharacterized protein LOC142586966 n=1 Tax=Dermacentor variabilis TaxID=34621 RepID=UPI003F5B5EAA
MAFRYIWLAVVCMALSSAVASIIPDDPCDFTNIQLDDEMFSKLLAKLPEGLEHGPQRFHSLLPGVDVGGMTVRGLSKLRQFGPPIPYCAKGKRMVQVDFYNGEPIEFASPWKTCSGQQGELALRSMFLRFTAQFTIVESSGEGLKLEFERALPVTTENIRVVVRGAGHVVLNTLEALSALLPSVLEEAWNRQFSYNLARAFRMARE